MIPRLFELPECQNGSFAIHPFSQLACEAQVPDAKDVERIYKIASIALACHCCIPACFFFPGSFKGRKTSAQVEQALLFASLGRSVLFIGRMLRKLFHPKASQTGHGESAHDGGSSTLDQAAKVRGVGFEMRMRMRMRMCFIRGPKP